MGKILRKVGIWLLITCMLAVQMPFAYAEESHAEPTLSATEVTGQPGDTVDVSIVMYNNPGIVSMQLDVGYDSSVLTLVKVTDGGLIGSAVHSNNLTLCPYRLTWANDLATTNYTANGTIVTLTFTIAEDAAVGEYPVTVNYTKNNFEIFDCDANEVDFTTVPGSVIIAEKQCNHTSKTEVPSKSADCVNSGNNLYFVCSSCGLAFKADGVTETTVEEETIPALGHDLSDATCTEAAECQRDGCSHVEGEALGHSFTNYASNNDATCTGDGTKTAKCDRCDVTDTITDVGSTKGHDFADATCTAPKTCKVCGATEGDALGHSFTNYVSNNDATCTADGTKTAKCDHCDVTDTIADAGSVKGHDYTNASCTTPKTCKICGATEGDPLGHSFTNYVSNNDATCTADGTKTAKCDHCDVTDTITDVGSSKGHSYAATWSKGEDGHWHECSVCGDKTDFAAHDYGDGDVCVICEYERAHIHRLTLVPSADATCTTDGNVAYYTCSGCENWFEDASGSVMITDKTSVVIEALGHDLADATCTEAAKCQREGCGHVEGEALGHSFTNYVSNNNATCTEDGTKTAKCDRCDVTDTITDVGSAKGHNYADATCTAPKTCKVCGTTGGEPLGHSFTNYVSNNDATCTEDGTKTAKCDRCDVTDTITDVGSAKGHDFADATCIAPKTCKVCGATEGDPLGHSYASSWSKGEDGHWHECFACGDKTDFAAHDYDNGDKCIVCEYERAHIHRLTLVSAVDATCTTDGNVAYYTCSGCENWFEDAAGSIVIPDKTSVVVAALGHDMSEATCTEAAYCQREGCDYTEGAALGHVDENADNKCDNCGVSMGGEQPTTPDKPTDDVPQTGDISKSMMWTVVLMLSIVGTIICVLFSKKKNMS